MIAIYDKTVGLITLSDAQGQSFRVKKIVSDDGILWQAHMYMFQAFLLVDDRFNNKLILDECCPDYYKRFCKAHEKVLNSCYNFNIAPSIKIVFTIPGHSEPYVFNEHVPNDYHNYNGVRLITENGKDFYASNKAVVSWEKDSSKEEFPLPLGFEIKPENKMVNDLKSDGDNIKYITVDAIPERRCQQFHFNIQGVPNGVTDIKIHLELMYNYTNPQTFEKESNGDYETIGGYYNKETNPNGWLIELFNSREEEGQTIDTYKWYTCGFESTPHETDHNFYPMDYYIDKFQIECRGKIYQPYSIHNKIITYAHSSGDAGIEEMSENLKEFFDVIVQNNYTMQWENFEEI